MAAGNKGFSEYRTLRKKYRDATGVDAPGQGWNLETLKRKCKAQGISTSCGSSCGCSICSDGSSSNKKGGEHNPFNSTIWKAF